MGTEEPREGLQVQVSRQFLHIAVFATHRKDLKYFSSKVSLKKPAEMANFFAFLVIILLRPLTCFGARRLTVNYDAFLNEQSGQQKTKKMFSTVVEEAKTP